MKTKHASTVSRIIRSLVIAALPLTASQVGCGVCASTTQTEKTTEEILVGVSGIALNREVCERFCGAGVETCVLSPNNTTFQVECRFPTSCPLPGAIDGRRPADLHLEAISGSDPVGVYFAQAMQAEAASIESFHILEDELRHHGAGRELIQAAQRAARDEIRHTKMTRALAERFGATATAPTVVRHAVRPLFEIAKENLVEGCVRETFSALLATWQAEQAEDPAIRGAMQRIAADELRHAELAWAVAAWVNPRLSAAEHAALDVLLVQAVDTLRQDMTVPCAERIQTVAGRPSPALAGVLVDKLAAELWA